MVATGGFGAVFAAETDIFKVGKSGYYTYRSQNDL